jgi:hypothetical protein
MKHFMTGAARRCHTGSMDDRWRWFLWCLAWGEIGRRIEWVWKISDYDPGDDWPF